MAPQKSADKPSGDIVGFAAFEIDLTESGSSELKKNGFLKISRQVRGPQAGILTFTFIIDTYGDEGLHRAVEGLFERFQEAGRDKEANRGFMAVRPRMEEVAGQDWLVAEVHFRYDTAEGGGRENIRTFFLPYLSMRLPVIFSDLSWWEDRSGQPRRSALGAIADFFRKQLGPGV